MGRASTASYAASAVCMSALDFKKLSKTDKASALSGQDVWPVKSIGMDKADNAVILVTAVHRPSQETVIGIPLHDTGLQSHAMWWHLFIGDVTDVQRSLVQTHVGKDASVWSHRTLMVDMQETSEPSSEPKYCQNFPVFTF